jgi:hypothetical protein
MEEMCLQMENTSKAIKFVNHGFLIIMTYSHIPGTFLMLLIYEYISVHSIYIIILFLWSNSETWSATLNCLKVFHFKRTEMGVHFGILYTVGSNIKE